MQNLSVLNMFIGFFFVMLIAGIIFLRFMVGDVGKEKRMSRMYRRNNLVIALIFLYLFINWIISYLKKDPAELSIAGWKLYALGLTGAASVLLLLYSYFKSRKK